MKLSVLTCVLLAVWPVANFLAQNMREKLDLRLVLAVAVGQILAAFVIGAAIHLLSFRKLSLNRTLPAAGLAMAFFLSYDLVEKAYLALGLSVTTQLYVWVALWIALTAVAVWGFRSERGRQAVCLAAIVLVAIPLLDYGYYRTRQAFRGGGAAAQGHPGSANSPAAGSPNVYFFLLDMYSRGDNLQRYYGYDNSQFLKLLEGKGFRIASQSFSNYPATDPSVSTTLYMDYFLPTVKADRTAVRRVSTPLTRSASFHVDSGPNVLTSGGDGWRPYGNNTAEKTADALRITRVGGSDSDKGAHLFLTPQSLLEPFVPGEPYRIEIIARVSAGAKIGLAITGEGLNADTIMTAPTFETYTLEFSPTSRTGHFVFFPRMEVGQSIWIKKFEIQHFASRLAKELAEPLPEPQFDRAMMNAYLGSHQHLSPVLTTFRKLGYHVLFANMAGTKTDACEPYCIEGQQNLTFQQVEMLGMTPIRESLRRFRPDIWKNVTTFYQKDPLDVVRKISPNAPEPYFLFAHILSPHPPYIYTASCELRDEFLFELDPSVALFKDREEMYTLYKEQLTCVNTRMAAALEEILKKDPDAIIVVQGDHGLGKLAEDQPHADKLRSRYGILNAFRIPQSCGRYLYDSISSVNTFRLIFSCLSGAEPVFVPDRQFEQFEETEYWQELRTGPLSPTRATSAVAPTRPPSGN